MNTQKYSASIITAFIVTILLVGRILAGQYFGSGGEGVALERPIVEEITEDKTDDWETYKNNEGSYEIRLPKNWEIEEMDKEVRAIFPDAYSSYVFKNDVTRAWIGVGVGLSAQEGLMGNLCQKLATLGDEEVKINNIVFMRGTIRDNAMGGLYSDYTIYRTLHDGTCYEILLAVRGHGVGAGANDGMGPLPQDYADSDSKEKFISIFDQIAYSFKFLEAN